VTLIAYLNSQLDGIILEVLPDQIFSLMSVEMVSLWSLTQLNTAMTVILQTMMAATVNARKKEPGGIVTHNQDPKQVDQYALISAEMEEEELQELTQVLLIS